MYRWCSINVYRCAEPHKFQAILKDDTDPACPRTLLVAKIVGRKNLTRELLDHRVTKFRVIRRWRKREGKRERVTEKEREYRRIGNEAGRKERKRREENSLVTVPIMRNEGWFVQRSDIEIRWNPIFIYYYPSTATISFCRLLSSPNKVVSAFTVARLSGFFALGMSSDFCR